MSIYFVLLFILNVHLYHTFSCDDPCLTYTNKSKIELCMKISKNTNCNVLVENNREYGYTIGDNITLTCVRIDSYHSSYASLLWKLHQYGKELLVTTSTDRLQKVYLSYEISIVLDRFDHGLIATCEADSNLNEKDYFIIRFNKNDTTVPENYKDTYLENIYYNEGETVRNTLNNTIYLFHNKENYKPDNVINPGQNMYDEITTAQNGLFYYAWYENFVSHKDQSNTSKDYKDLKTDSKSILHKKKWQVFVKPFAEPNNPISGENSSVDTTFPTSAVVAGVVSLLVVISITIFVYFKYFKKTEIIEDQYEHIYAEPTHVVYAEIDLKVTNEPAPSRPEEPYAQIIGIFKPKKKPIITTSN